MSCNCCGVSAPCCTAPIPRNLTVQITGCGDNLQVQMTYAGLDGNNNQHWTFNWLSACGHTMYGLFTCVQNCVTGPNQCNCLALGISCNNTIFGQCTGAIGDPVCNCPPNLSYLIHACSPVSCAFGDPCGSCAWGFHVFPTP